VKELNAEQLRLKEQYSGNRNWLKWGPYLSERQWGTVREDYSSDGNTWDYFPHDQARSRTYRWGEDGLAGICDESCRLCFAVGLWNRKDPVIKERLFGLSGSEGNHGEDVKELYYYLDSTPTHSYMKHLYKYPRATFPYKELVQTNRNRTKQEDEFELYDTGIFKDGNYFDVFTEYTKAGEEDILIKIIIHNHSTEKAGLSVLPSLWLRNLWSFGLMKERPSINTGKINKSYGYVKVTHESLGNYYLYFQEPDRLLFTENETNNERISGIPNASPFVKDAINDAVVSQKFDLFEAKESGTRFSPVYELEIEPGDSREIRLRLSKSLFRANPLIKEFEKIFNFRIEEADTFYNQLCVEDKDLKNIQRQAFAGMLWNKQYYNIDMPRWLNGDPGQPAPPESRRNGRNNNWLTLNNEDIISMPDKWEYPWYAAWDLAFHCVPLAMVDPDFAKNQLILFLREWYMRPNGQLPAYEGAFSDVNPPVHAWACLQVYRLDKKQKGNGDLSFLKRVFQKLLINFTWWVNRKDHNDKNVFEGGFLGLDNIGVFDRSTFIPGVGHLEQADGTSWMAMYCLNMLDIALELAQEDRTYEDVATKFFEHFVYIADSLNRMGENWTGAWDEHEGFFYDILARPDGSFVPLKVRSLVGLTTFFATLVLDRERLKNVPDFVKRFVWFRNYRLQNNYYIVIEEMKDNEDIILSLTPRKRIQKLLKALLDEDEFFSPSGIRSVSKIHEKPYTIKINHEEYALKYEPAESSNSLFGGNSNWRGPVWMPMNYLMVQSLRTLYQYYGNTLTSPCPTGTDSESDLKKIADELSMRLISIFKQDNNGKRRVNGNNPFYDNDPYSNDLILFYEYFNGDTGKGIGASHQTGWTGLVAELIDQLYKNN
jgi:hypothetical protein